MSKFWGHVQADDASNNAQKEASDLAEHVRTLQGQDALDAQKTAYDSLDKIYAKYKNQLGTPEQQRIFETQNRPFFDRYVRGQLNTVFIDAGRQFAVKTADASSEVAHSMAATAGTDDNWANVEVAYHKDLSAQVKKLTAAGENRDPDAMQRARDKAALIYKSGIEGMLVKNPDGALAKIDDPKIIKALGANYDTVAKEVRSAAAAAYVSRADAMAVDNPVKAEEFVRANEAKFGNSYGAALERAQTATKIGKAKALAEGSKAATEPGGFKFDPKTAPAKAVGRNTTTGEYLFPAETNRDGSPAPLPTSPAAFKADDAAGKADIAAREAAGGARTASVDDLFNAFHGQESGGGRNITTSIDNAHGDMQIIPSTFAAYARPGERIDNRADNIAVGKRILADLSQKYNGDAARVAVAYFSGPGNVAPPGSATPWKENRRDGQGTSVSQYVNGILTRLGHPGLSGGPHPISTTPRPGETLARPGYEGVTPTAASDEIPSAKASEAAFTPPKLPEREQTPEEIKNALYQQEAQRLRWINSQEGDIGTKEDAANRVQAETRFLLAQAEEKEAARKAREDEATTNVLGTARKIGYPAAYKLLNSYMDDPKRPISEQHFNALSKSLEQDSADPNPVEYGPGYSSTISRILAPAGDPSRIGSVRQLVELKAAGKLSRKGFDDAYKTMTSLQKSEDEYGLQAMAQEGRKALEHKLTAGGMDPLTGKPFDAHGAELFQTKGIARYNAAFTAWRELVKEGKADPSDFPLSDPKKLQALADSIYPPQERAYLRQVAQNTELPTIPENVNPKGWGEVYGMRLDNPAWGPALAKLAADPAKQAPIWDAKGPGTVISAKEALEKMGIAYTPPEKAAGLGPMPQRPHAQTTPDKLQSAEYDRQFDEWLKSIPSWAAERLGIKSGPVNEAKETAKREGVANARRQLGGN